MATRKRRNKGIILITSLIFVLGISFIISYSDNPSIPTWNEIYKFFNISTNSVSTDVNNYSMSVHVIDVGKADSIYIKAENKNILIDSADTDTKGKVLEYLKNQNVSKLDLVIATHPHKDHIAGMPDIISKFPIDKFIMSELPDDIVPTTKTYTTMLKSMGEKSIEPQKSVVGDSFYIGSLKIDVLGPINKYDSLNNNSVVVKLTYGEESFLMMGDAEKESEKDLIKSGADLKASVLKIGHHGSATSSTENFLKSVNPKYSVISVGPDSNNLPKDSTVKRLNKLGIKNYRTDTDGTVVFATNGYGIDVFT